MSNFKPLHDRVLVKRLPSEEKTAGGIIIPDSVQEKPQQGEIIAAGSGSRRADGNIDPLGVKVADKILFGKYAGTEVKMQGVDYIIMKETDILGVLE